MSTPLYERVCARAADDDNELMREVWDPTPWMIEVFLGKWEKPVYVDEQAIREWCCEHFGEEGSPIHERDGSWYTGGVIINGWCRFGFDTEEHMRQFMAAWPYNIEEEH